MLTEPRLSNKALETVANEFRPYDHDVYSIIHILMDARNIGREEHLKQLLIQFARHDMEFKGEWVTRGELNEMIQEEIERKM